MGSLCSRNELQNFEHITVHFKTKFGVPGMIIIKNGLPDDELCKTEIACYKKLKTIASCKMELVQQTVLIEKDDCVTIMMPFLKSVNKVNAKNWKNLLTYYRGFIDANIVHNDIKEENIGANSEGGLEIRDFDISSAPNDIFEDYIGSVFLTKIASRGFDVLALFFVCLTIIHDYEVDATVDEVFDCFKTAGYTQYLSVGIQEYHSKIIIINSNATEQLKNFVCSTLEDLQKLK